MANVKTAISLPQPLFEQAEALAHELQISRSRLFAQAVEEYIRRYQNRQLLDAINAAYSDAPDAEEEDLLQRMQSQQRRLLEGEW